MKRPWAILFLLTGCILWSGCATVLTGDDQIVTFTSHPEGATVYVDGVPQGQTPLSVTMERGFGAHDVSFQKKGYTTAQVELGHSFNGWFLLNLITPWSGVVIGMLVDLATGAIVWMSPTHLHVELVSKGSRSKDDDSP